MTDNNSNTANSSSFPPSDWVETTLGEVGKTITGKTPSTKEDSFWNGEIPFITPTDINNDLRYCIPARTISEKGKESLKTTIIPKDAICYTSIASIGLLCISKQESLTNQQINSLIVDENNDHLFFYYYLKFLTPSLKKIAGGTTTHIINKTQFENFPILLPPLSEQQAIASVLSAFDDKIELLREENKTLEELGQVIFKEWFGKYGVDDALPEGWRVGKLGEICEITSGKRPENISEIKTELNKIPLLGATKIMGFVENYLFDGRTLIIGRVGTHGEVQRFNEKIFPSDNTLVIKSDDFVFVYQILKSIDYVKMNRGAVQPLITQTDLKNYEIIIPNDEVLQNFKEATNPVFEKIDQNNSQIQSLARSRDELLPRLMSGEVRVEF